MHTWRCECCESFNDEQAKVCWVCDRPRYAVPAGQPDDGQCAPHGDSAEHQDGRLRSLSRLLTAVDAILAAVLGIVLLVCVLI